MWDEVKTLVAKAAPLAGTLLGGPAGTAVGAMIASALGVENEPDAIQSAITNDPESAIKLRQMEIDNQLELKRLTLRYAELQMQENANAREMQIEALKQGDRFSKRFVYYLACFWSVAASVYIGAITFCEIPEGSMRFADTAQGFVLGTVVATIIGFFYGAAIKPDSSNS